MVPPAGSSCRKCPMQLQIQVSNRIRKCRLATVDEAR